MQEEIIVEEAIAELFANKDLLVNTPPKVEGIFNKIIEFFRSMGQAMRSSGYKSAQEIFNDIESGKLGSRERGVVRTTRLGDKERSIFLDRIPTQDEPGRREILGEDITSDLSPAGIRPISIPKPTPTTPTPPAGPTTPPTTPITSPVPNKIYDSRQMSFIEKANERQFILDNLKKAGVFNPRSRAKGDSVKMMKWLKNNAPNQDYKIIATKVHQSLVGLKKLGYDFPLEITQDKTKTKGFRGRVSYLSSRPTYFEMRINDMYGKDIADTIKDLEKLKPGAMGNPDFSVTNRPGNQTVVNYIKNSNGVNFETLLHEGIHQATVAQMELAGGTGSKNKKIAKAYKDLQKQRETVEKFVTDKLQEMSTLSISVSKGEITPKQFMNNFINLPVDFRNKALDIYMDGEKSTPQQIVRNSDAVIARRYREFTQDLIDYKINGMQKGSALPDSSEFLTFGLTNRDFQDLLESIPTKTDPTKTVWDTFVETIRNILGLPAKLNTELSAFLKNATTVLDLQSEGVPLAGDNRPGGIAEEVSLFSRGPRDESSGMAADYVPVTKGPRASNLLEEVDGDNFSPSDIYKNPKYYMSSQRGEPIFKEVIAFIEKLKQIKGNPNATITMYRAAPTNDLRAGDLITPSKTEAQNYVNESKITQQEVRDADRARRRQEQIDKTGAVDLRQEKLYNQMDGIIDVFGAPQTTLSELFTYELKAGDVRWDGNQLERWGYFPSKVKDIGGDIPTFSRTADQAYFEKEERNKRISNIKEIIRFKQRQLETERAYMTDATANRLEKEIQKSQATLAKLTAGDVSLFSRANLTPKDNEVPFDATSNIRFETGAILDQLEMSREEGGNINNPSPLKMAIVEAFRGKQNRPLALASTKFLEKFTNNKGNLILFRALNIPEGKNIKNYGQLPEDLFASTTLDSRKALQISRNLFSRAQSKGATWNPEILRYEVPMSKVKGYVPMLLKAMKSEYIDMLEDSYNGSGIMSQYELDTAIEEADEQEDYYKYSGVRSKEEYFEDDMYQYDEYIKEAEVLADLRGIKPTYQYSPMTSNRDASLLKDVPLFRRGQRFDNGSNTQENIQLREALAEAEETVKQTPRGSIPFYNLNASDQALEIALEFNKDISAKTPEDIPTFSKPTLDGVDSGLIDFIDRTGGVYEPVKSWGARLIEIVKDPITSFKNAFGNFRQNFIDKLDKVDKKIMQASEDNEDVRYYNNTADTATMAALRLADRARGLFQGMLTRGYVSDVIEGNSALANIKDLELQNGETGGLIQILSPLFSNPELNLEKIFKAYATLKRAESFDKQGRLIETPVKAEDYAYIQLIEQQHPEVVEVFNNYQTWNNRLITFAEKKGLLDPEQADLWREHSSYYPFYKNMVDDAGIQGPVIAGGSLPNNPLSIKIEGSENPLDVDPIEAISRNSLSILTAALKNDGTSKLLRDLQSIGEARPVTPKQAGKLNTIFVFENGNKQFYEVDDVNLFHGIQGIGGVNTGTITKILAAPAGLLRDTVTRDPGFVVINILRDTLSSAVTSGAPYTPVVDSVKNMFRDMENLEKFGVLGGYDFSNDEGSVKQFITRTMRQQGLSPSNGMSASGAFFKLWDGLGALTTKSDGATRLAVYEGVYKKLKDEGYTEAQAQSEAAFQALEIINFGRRGLDPMFKVITAAIPFLNARVQGLDVLYRGFTGQYSSVEKLQQGETLEDVQSRILKRAFLNAGLLVSLTALYYMMVSDTDEYKNLKREVRDDNWVFPIGSGHAVKIPIPFEVGMLFKAIPERVFDMTMGDDAFTRKSVNEALTSIKRQAGTSANIPFFQPGGGIQLLKPISEVMNNRNTFTNTEIVPYYQQQKEPAYQSRATTNELAKIMGEFLNVSPTKIEHVMKGYTGTLGGYVLSAIDSITRGATGSPLLPSNFELRKMPVINRLLLDLDKSGGYQQQFYELRSEVDKAVQTINSLQKQQRFDELSAYRSNMQGVLNIKGQVRAIERYLKNWRQRRDRLMLNENISLTVKSDMLRELELERDKRLALVPEMRKRAEIPVMNINL